MKKLSPKKRSKTQKNFKKINRNFYIENLGCAKNQVDAETMIACLTGNGWVYTSADNADMIIINSCGFINPAKEESLDTLLSFRQQYPDKKIVLAGCLAQRYGKELAAPGADALPEADAFFGNKALHEIVNAADAFMNGVKKVYIPEQAIETEVPAFAGRAAGDGAEGRANRKPKTPTAAAANGSKARPREMLPRVSLSFPGSIYVKIAEGCDNNCTYCAIPLIRGKLKSRKSKEIIDEIKEIIGQGFFEINLVAQDLASYGNDIRYGNTSRSKENLITLLEKISSLSGKIWIRLLYMHPNHFDPAVLEIMKSDKRIIPYFDIPFQHASENILSKMGRKGNFSSNLKIIETIRSAIPESVIRSTFLLGFPGEKNKDYLLVEEFLKEAKLDWAGFFPYSQEEDTPAFDMGRSFNNFITQGTIQKRVLKLQDYQSKITEQNLCRFVGKTFDILAEEEFLSEDPEAEEDIILGRGYMNAPDVDGAVIIHNESRKKIKPGKVVKCKITRRNNIDLEAIPV